MTTPLGYFLEYLSRQALSNAELSSVLLQDKAIDIYFPSHTGAGTFGLRQQQEQACVYGKPLLLIDVKKITDLINRYFGAFIFKADDLLIDAEDMFVSSMDIPESGSNLVLAPYGFRTRFTHTQYTALNKEEALRLYPGFHNLELKQHK